MDKCDIIDKQNVTMLVNSCDLYQDIWPMFFCALKEYWPDRDMNIILNTESKNIDFKVDGLTVHHFIDDSGKDKWGARFLKVLQSIKSEYVVVVYDDFILESRFDSRRLRALIKHMDLNKNIAVSYLVALGLPTKLDKRHKDQVVLQDNVDYRLNSAPALWRRENLIEYTGPNDNPWAWEVFGSYRTYNDKKLFYAPIAPESDLYVYNHKKGGAIYRGKWVSEVVLLKKKKYDLNINFNVRGFSSEYLPEKRSLAWKLKFILLGFKMVKFKFLYCIRYYVREKLK